MTIFVICEKICTFPIIGKLNAIKSIIRQKTCYFLEIKNLFLTGI